MYRITWPATDTACEVVESHPSAQAAYAAIVSSGSDPGLVGRSYICRDPGGRSVALVGPAWALEIIEIDEDAVEVRS